MSKNFKHTSYKTSKCAKGHFQISLKVNINCLKLGEFFTPTLDKEPKKHSRTKSWSAVIYSLK